MGIIEIWMLIDVYFIFFRDEKKTSTRKQKKNSLIFQKHAVAKSLVNSKTFTHKKNSIAG